MTGKISIGWRAYGALVTALSWLHYAVLSRFGRSDEGGAAWFRRRLQPTLPQPVSSPRIWIHAVSAGESKVAELLRARLLARDPELSVILSATTYSGYARVSSIAGEAQSFVLPLDTLAAQRRVIAETAPDLLVLVESEFWPAQFAAAAEAGVPVVVVNATMSPRSFARHLRNPAVANRTIVGAAHIYAQDEAYADRYAQLGVPRDRLTVAGNLKLVPMVTATAIEKSDPPVAAFGNVHRDELPVLAPAIAALRKARPDIQVVLVPRYPGKIPGEVLSAQLGGQLAIVDHIGELREAGPLVWLDEMGTLSQVYAMATIGIVCGTFAGTGGHDLSEPLHAGAASIYGPDVARQRPTNAALSALDCAVQVENAGQLADAINGLLDDSARRNRMIAAFSSVSSAAGQQLDRLVDDVLARLKR